MVFSAIPPDETAGQANLLAPLCAGCPAESFCTDRFTSPCGCRYPRSHSLYRECARCVYDCRQRDGVAGVQVAELLRRYGDSIPSFAAVESPAGPFPVFLPLRTEQFPSGDIIPFRMTAVGPRNLFRQRSDGSLYLRPELSDPLHFRHALRISNGASVACILSANDDILSGLRAFPRERLFDRLHACGIRVVTAPTFSIYRESRQWSTYQNHVHRAMHNLVLHELNDAGFHAIPNLYWRTREDIGKWSQWLRHNPGVNLVSRDFSRSKQPGMFGDHLDGLLDLVNDCGRRMHVFLVGVGVRNGQEAIRLLADRGHTATVVSAHPILAASSGGRHFATTAGGWRMVSSSRPRVDLMMENLVVAEDVLLSSALRYPELYSPSNRNYTG